MESLAVVLRIVHREARVGRRETCSEAMQVIQEKETNGLDRVLEWRW